MATGRIIFLDIDGALATRPMTPRAMPRGFGMSQGLGRAAIPSVQRKPPRALRAQPIAFLNQICAEAEAQLVISSSWRLRGDLRPALVDAGVTGRFHEDWATDVDGPQRGDEIERWLTAHAGAQYVVLDDWSHGLERHASRTVLSDFRIGLTAQDARAAVALLHSSCLPACSRLVTLDGRWPPGSWAGQRGLYT
jgi:hypothetical protein